MTNTTGPLHPNYTWAQRKDRVFLTIDIQDAAQEKLEVTPEGRVTFKGKDKEGHLYELDIELFEGINVEESKYGVKPRNVQFMLMKQESGDHWPRLLKQAGKAPHNQKVDWSMYVDEDEEDEAQDNFGNFNMDMDSLNLGGDADMDDSDDESDDDLPDLVAETKE